MYPVSSPTMATGVFLEVISIAVIVLPIGPTEGIVSCRVVFAAAPPPPLPPPASLYI